MSSADRVIFLHHRVQWLQKSMFARPGPCVLDCSHRPHWDTMNTHMFCAVQFRKTHLFAPEKGKTFCLWCKFELSK